MRLSGELEACKHRLGEPGNVKERRMYVIRTHGPLVQTCHFRQPILLTPSKASVLGVCKSTKTPPLPHFTTLWSPLYHYHYHRTMAVVMPDRQRSKECASSGLK